MPYLNWTPKLDVGVDAMNREHQELIDRMNAFYDAAHGSSADAIRGALDALGSYVVEHFAHEEAYMDSVDFPGRQNHKQIHKNLLRSYSEYADAIAETGEVPEKFLNFLKFWLTSHIKGIDTKYGEHMAGVSKAS
ncbi:MAG: bacteriohemerythrin [Myxococcales bacterium]|nr:bacteriohemerythrin [Myxococcales bacterium]